MPPSRSPFFRSHFSSRDPPFQALFQLQRTHFNFLKKILHFKTNFWLILTKFVVPETLILAKICSRDPSFKPKTSVLENLFLETWAAHTYPNICLLPPPGVHPARTLHKLITAQSSSSSSSSNSIMQLCTSSMLFLIFSKIFIFSKINNCSKHMILDVTSSWT